MATNTFVPLELPEAAELADLTGISFDLTTARKYATQIKNAYSNQDFDSIDSLTIATLIMYLRPFSEGIRLRLGKETLSLLSPSQRAYHDYLYEIRRRHIAHSVNHFEASKPIARYWVERVHTEGITSVECNHERIVGISAQDADAVIDLTTTILRHVEERIENEKKKLLKIVRAMPLEVVLAGIDQPSTPTDPAAVRTQRLPKLRKKRPAGAGRHVRPTPRGSS